MSVLVSHILSTIKDMVTNDIECQVPWKNSLTLAMKIRIQDSVNLLHMVSRIQLTLAQLFLKAFKLLDIFYESQ